MSTCPASFGHSTKWWYYVSIPFHLDNGDSDKDSKYLDASLFFFSEACSDMLEPSDELLMLAATLIDALPSKATESGSAPSDF